jgi:hypothetical protein
MHVTHRFAESLKVVLPPLMLGGCIVHMPQYPSNWSPVRDAGNSECVDLTGRFENVGRSDDEHVPIYLMSWLFPTGSGAELASSIELQSAGTSITAIASLQDGSTRSALLKQRGKCTATERHFADPNEAGGMNREGVVGYAHSSLTLMRAENGSLVVTETSSGAAMVLLIPVAGHTRTWAIFEQSQSQ